MIVLRNVQKGATGCASLRKSCVCFPIFFSPQYNLVSLLHNPRRPHFLALLTVVPVGGHVFQTTCASFPITAVGWWNLSTYFTSVAR